MSQRLRTSTAYSEESQKPLSLAPSGTPSRIREVFTPEEATMGSMKLVQKCRIPRTVTWHRTVP
ncbi:hypothetical protein GCM10027290_31250 [Micromonospora sonneratiae]